MKALKFALPMAAVVSVGMMLSPVQSQTPEGMPWFLDIMPQAAKQAAWDEFQAIYADDTQVPSKYKELIALAVSAQVPCHYCIYAHDKRARDAGATEEEIREALAVASMVRKWSTMVNGVQTDFEKFKTAVDGVD